MLSLMHSTNANILQGITDLALSCVAAEAEGYQLSFCSVVCRNALKSAPARERPDFLCERQKRLFFFGGQFGVGFPL